MTPSEQAAVNYMADVLDTSASAAQRAQSLEIAEIYFEQIPEAERRKAIVRAAAEAVARSMNDR